MRVWVLGAGFSARLGGPMLNDLLSTRALEILRIRHPGSWLHDAEPDLAVQVYQQGQKLGYWSNAELFLSAVSSYDEHYQRACGDVLRSISSGDALKLFENRQSHETPDEAATDRIAHAATAVVAAQCQDFVDVVVDDNEAWLPYDRWVKALTAEDVIVSFNYDLVVEKAFQRQKRTLSIPNPRLNRMHVDGSCPVLLKLHGSVRFRDTIKNPREPYDVRSLSGNPALIAVPGKGKSSMAGTDFSELWDLAERSLKEAGGVHIVGYSCPASDEMAKAWLLDSLAHPLAGRRVALVLGPGGSTDARRLRALIELANVHCVDTQVWAQDYLTAYGLKRGWRPQLWSEEALEPYYEDGD